MASTNEGASKMTAIGIDLGSLNARVAIGPSSSSSIPTMVSSAQGARYTLAISTPDQSSSDGSDGDNNNSNAHYVFGEAARRSLQRGGGGSENTRLVRHLSTLSVSDILDDDDDDEEFKKEQEEAKEEAAKASNAFLAHLATLACDATSSTASSSRIVLSVPNDASHDMIQGIVQRTEDGVKSLIPSAEKKSIKKRVKKGECDDNVVLAVLTDAAAVCLAHGLPSVTANDATAATVKNILVIDWGATGLSLTHLTNLGSSSSSNVLSTVRSTTSSSLSGSAIRTLLVKHCAQLFERKNRLPLGTIMEESKKARLKLQNVCDETLRTLSKSNSVPVTIDGLYDGLDLNVVISKPRFDVLCHSLLRQAEEILMTFAHVVPDDGNKEGETKKRQRYDAVLLSGGVCQMISAKNLITKIFPPCAAEAADDDDTFPGKCWRGNPSIPPEEAIAMGCALHCSTLLQPENYSVLYPAGEGKKGGHYLKTHPLLKDVPTSPVEISASCSILSSPVVIIEEGTPLPANVTKTIMLSPQKTEEGKEEVSGGDGISLGIVQTKVDGSKTDKLVGKVDGISKDTSSIELTLELTREGKLIMAVNGGESVIV